MGLVASTTASCTGLFGRRRSSPPPLTTRRADGSPPPPTPPTKTTKVVREPELVRVFRLLDADGDGLISAAEMRRVFSHCTDEAASEMVAAADRDGDGFVSLEEFLAVMDGGDRSSDTRATFDEFDTNGDGVITAEELRLVLRRLGLGGDELTVAMCEEMVAAYDINGDGVLSFEEFVVMMADDEPAA